MNLNQVTLPAVDVGPAVDFYSRLGLRLIVEDLPRYARFELPDGESTLSIERVSEATAGHGLWSTSSARIWIRPSTASERMESNSTVCPLISRGYGERLGCGILGEIPSACIGLAETAATHHGG